MKNNTATNLDVVAPYVTPQLATSVTASCINFVIIMILNLLYERVAIKITDMGEGPQQVFCVYSFFCVYSRQFTSSKFSTDKMWKCIKNKCLLFYRNSEDPRGVWEQTDSEDVPLPVCQLLLFLLLRGLL